MFIHTSKLPALLLRLLLLFAISTHAVAQQRGADPAYKPLTGGDYVTSKNYYLLTLFESLPEIKKILEKDEALQAIGKLKSDSLAAALTNCGSNGDCYIRQLQFSNTDIEKVADRLKAIYSASVEMRNLVRDHLLPSGAYLLFQQLPPAELLAKAWEQDATGINFTIAIYGAGQKPNYPLIDSISFTVKDPTNTYNRGYLSLLHNTSYLVHVSRSAKPVFFQAPLAAALLFLSMNERTQAADFEPMEKGENAAAIARIGKTDWSKYAYTLILVPGAGPDQPGVPLSAEGMIRCQLAARLYREGLAPFIVVSGGKVHPYKTSFCEATEMKKYLVETLKLPAAAIIIEPHARHTTTNMRNTARLMFRYGIPFENKPALTCTTRGQSLMIEKTLQERCRRELGTIPFKPGKRLSETELEFFALTDALQLNPKEPLDP